MREYKSLGEKNTAIRSEEKLALDSDALLGLQARDYSLMFFMVSSPELRKRVGPRTQLCGVDDWRRIKSCTLYFGSGNHELIRMYYSTIYAI